MIAKCLLLVALLAVGASQIQKAHFEREIQFDAVWTSYAKLLDCVQKSREFALKANGDTVNDVDQIWNKDSLAVSDGNQSVTVEFGGNFAPVNLDGRSLPSQSTSVKYEFARHKGSPISGITISFGELIRNKIAIHGSDQTQVDAASAMLLNALQPQTTIFGNTGFKFSIFAVSLIVGTLFLAAATQQESPARGKTRVFLLMAAVLIAAIIFSGRIERALPSCSISDGQGWLNDNNALFTFLGLILSIVTPLLGPLWNHFHTNTGSAIRSQRRSPGPEASA